MQQGQISTLVFCHLLYRGQPCSGIRCSCTSRISLISLPQYLLPFVLAYAHFQKKCSTVLLYCYSTALYFYTSLYILIIFLTIIIIYSPFLTPVILPVPSPRNSLLYGVQKQIFSLLGLELTKHRDKREHMVAIIHTKHGECFPIHIWVPQSSCLDDCSNLVALRKLKNCTISGTIKKTKNCLDKGSFYTRCTSSFAFAWNDMQILVITVF